MRRLSFWVMTGAVTCALSFVQAPAFAQAKPKPAATAKPDLNEAKQRYSAGETKFKAGDYAGALADFQVADGIKATPQAARYIAMSQDKLGKYQEAVAAYERFLAEVPAKLQAEGDVAKKRVEEIKAMPGKVKVETTPPGATITVDGKPAAQPSPTVLELPPGRYTLLLGAPGHVDTERTVEVAYASTQDLTVELPEAPPVAALPPPVEAPPPVVEAPAEPPPEPRSLVPAFITGGLALAAAGVGTAFGIMALGDKSDFDENPTAQKADDGENHALIADMAFGVAITMGVTSAVLFLTRDEPSSGPRGAQPKVRPSKPSKPTFTAAPVVTPHGGGAGALVRF